MTKKTSKREVNWTHYNIALIAGILSFLAVSLIVAQYFHELSHMLVLKILGCLYYPDIKFDAINLSANIYMQCDLDKVGLASVYLSGIFGTLLAGFILLALDWILTRKNHLELSIFFSYVALGFLYSPTLYFFKTTGDIVNTLDLLGISYTYMALKLAGMALMLSYLSYFIMNFRYIAGKEISRVSSGTEEKNR